MPLPPAPSESFPSASTPPRTFRLRALKLLLDFEEEDFPDEKERLFNSLADLGLDVDLESFDVSAMGLFGSGNGGSPFSEDR